MPSLKNFIYLFSVFFFSFALINSSIADDYPQGFPKCYKDKTNGIKWSGLDRDFCPINRNTKLGHKLIIVDFTTKHAPFQRDFILNTAFGKALPEETEPYHKLSFVRIDQNSASQQKPFFAKCRMKTGNGKLSAENLDGTNKKCEGRKRIKELFAAFVEEMALTTSDFCLIGDCGLTYKKYIDAIVQKAVNRAKEDEKEISTEDIEKYRTKVTKKINKDKFFPPRFTSPSGSYIYETIIEVLRNKNFDFSNQYPERKLIIVSDLVQISKRFSLSHTNGYCKPKILANQKKKYCGDLKGLLKKYKETKVYLEQTKLDKKLLENLKVKVLFLNHNYSCETNPKAAESMQKLWVELFNYMGINNIEWEWQLDPNTKPSC